MLTLFLSKLQLNEMNVMHQHQQQMGGPPPGLTSPPMSQMANKYAGLLGLGSFMPNNNQHHSPSPSPISDKPPSSVSPSPSLLNNGVADSPPPLPTSLQRKEPIQRIWDLHYERKSNNIESGNHEENSTAPIDSMPLLAPPNRSEGLAA